MQNIKFPLILLTLGLTLTPIAFSSSAHADEIDFPAQGRPTGVSTEQSRGEGFDAEMKLNGSAALGMTSSTSDPTYRFKLQAEAGRTLFENLWSLGDKAGTELAAAVRLNHEALPEGRAEQDLELGRFTLVRIGYDQNRAVARPLGAGEQYQVKQMESVTEPGAAFGRRMDLRIGTLDYQYHDSPKLHSKVSGARIGMQGGYSSRHVIDALGGTDPARGLSIDWCLAAQASVMPDIGEDSHVSGQAVEGAQLAAALKGCLGVQLGEIIHIGSEVELGTQHFSSLSKDRQGDESASISNFRFGVSVDKPMGIPISIIATHERESAVAGSAVATEVKSNYLSIGGGF